MTLVSTLSLPRLCGRRTREPRESCREGSGWGVGGKVPGRPRGSVNRQSSRARMGRDVPLRSGSISRRDLENLSDSRHPPDLRRDGSVHRTLIPGHVSWRVERHRVGKFRRRDTDPFLCNPIPFPSGCPGDPVTDPGLLQRPKTL